MLPTWCISNLQSEVHPLEPPWSVATPYENVWAYVDSKGPDQPTNLCSLIRAFPVRCQNHWILQKVSMESKCPDETAHVQDDVNLHIFRMLKGTFSLDTVQMLPLSPG